jgi:hypothetical protein
MFMGIKPTIFYEFTVETYSQEWFEETFKEAANGIIYDIVSKTPGVSEDGVKYVEYRIAAEKSIPLLDNLS